MFYAFYIDWEGLFNSIAAYPYFEVQWKSFENQWAEASKTKIIDCFQTPAGSRITNQNSSQGCLKLVLQILQPHIQTKKNDNLEIHFRLSTHEVYLFDILTRLLIYSCMLIASMVWSVIGKKRCVLFCFVCFSRLFRLYRPDAVRWSSPPQSCLPGCLEVHFQSICCNCRQSVHLGVF